MIEKQVRNHWFDRRYVRRSNRRSDLATKPRTRSRMRRRQNHWWRSWHYAPPMSELEKQLAAIVA
jgi:hypothetical protein